MLGDPFTEAGRKPEELLTCDQLLQLTAAHRIYILKEGKKYPSCTGLKMKQHHFFCWQSRQWSTVESQGREAKAPPSDERRDEAISEENRDLSEDPERLSPMLTCRGSGSIP